MSETKEQIKDRLIRNAARIWGFSETQPENNFDPLVAMLLGACAVELEKVSNQVEGTRGRVLERLVQLLFPEVLATALPAHALAHGLATEPTARLSAETQFYTQKRIASRQPGEPPVWKDIFFSPSGPFRLHQTSVRYLVAGSSLFAINNSLGKELGSRAIHPTPPQHAHTLWMAIDQPENDLTDVSVYFDTQDEATQALFYHYLPLARWYLDDVPVAVTAGFGNNAVVENPRSLERILQTNANATDQLLGHVNAFYAHRFVTIVQLAHPSLRKNAPVTAPAFLAQHFPPKDLEKLTGQPLVWLRVEFSPIVHQKLLANVTVRLNCFPVINRRQFFLQERLQKHVNIIPLLAGDHFLGVSEIRDESGSDLSAMSGSPDQETPSVSLRYGNVGRFDQRDAARVIEGVIQQVREEGVAYSVLGSEMAQNELKAIQQSLNKLEQQITYQNLLKGEKPYLIFTNVTQSEYATAFIRYWTTNGAEANATRADAPLFIYQGADVHSTGLKLITNTHGGRNSLNNQEKVLAYKSALLSRERLVTQEDIASFCRMRLGLVAASVRVSRGVVLKPGRSHGYEKTIDVTLGLTKKDRQALEERGNLSFWEEDLTLAIGQRSNFFMPLRVFIGEEQ